MNLSCYPKDDCRSPTAYCEKIKHTLTQKKTIATRSTISRQLTKELALLLFKLTRKRVLTPSMKMKQLTLTQKHKNWTVQQRSIVLFSNKSNISNIVHVCHPINKSHTIPIVKQPQSQMIWDAKFVSGTAALCFLLPKTIVNGN